MSDELAGPDVVALFYRADWTRLSLSARVSGMVDFGGLASQAESASPLGRGTPHSLLPPAHLGVWRFAGTLRLTPGGRFVVDITEPASIDAVDPLDKIFLSRNGLCSTTGNAPTGPPYPDLLRPVRLLNGYMLELRAEISDAAAAGAPGRRALAVVATPVAGARADQVTRPDRIEVIADAETGILLRSEETFEGRTVRMTELSKVRFGAPGNAWTAAADENDRGLYDRVSEAFPGFSGPGWTAAKTAMNAAGTVLGSVIRHAPGRSGGPGAGPADPEAAMPSDDEENDPADPPEGESGALADGYDELLHAMHGSGRAEFSGILHTWTDVAMMSHRARSTATEHGWGGVGSFADAIGDRLGVVHTVCEVRTGGGGRYRVEHTLPARTDMPRILTCDGEQLWREFADKVVVSPALPLKNELADLVDTSPLLEWQLAGVRETVLGGRRAFALRAARARLALRAGRALGSWAGPHTMLGSDIVVDAELGIVLRLVQRVGGKPAYRCEFRDVAAGRGNDEAFRGRVPPGVRVVRADGSLLDDVVVTWPDPVRIAAKAAGSGLKAARGLFDSLSDRRSR